MVWLLYEFWQVIVFFFFEVSLLCRFATLIVLLRRWTALLTTAALHLVLLFPPFRLILVGRVYHILDLIEVVELKLCSSLIC